EYDEETGNYYYGARYYDPKWSMFIGVDPLADKYPDWSSYAYCFNNPIKYIDPTGMEAFEGDPPKGTYIIIYGAGWDNPQSKSSNQGDSFKLNAEAQKQELINNGVPETSIVLGRAQTKEEFLNIVNKEYESGEIIQMDIYSHSYANGINFGGYEGMEPPQGESTPADKAYRLLFKTDISQINKENFSKDSKVTIWGCNAGKEVNGQEPIAQVFVNHLDRGGDNIVRAQDNYSEHKRGKNGLIYDGTMIKSVDRSTQKVNLTIFKPKKQ
ncbi:RHS repeat-associated core domain-containing protein, partial [Flavobacterium sp. ST-75]